MPAPTTLNRIPITAISIIRRLPWNRPPGPRLSTKSGFGRWEWMKMNDQSENENLIGRRGMTLHIYSCEKCSAEYLFKRKSAFLLFGANCPFCGLYMSSIPIARYTLTPPPELKMIYRNIKVINVRLPALNRKYPLKFRFEIRKDDFYGFPSF